MSVGSSTLSGAATGASLGSIAGPWGTAIGAVGGAAVGLIGGLSGKKKRDAAAKAAADRPEYRIPKEVYQNKAMYEAMAKSSRVPGQDQIEKQIGQTEARSLNASQRAAGSSADALSAVGNIQQNTLDQQGQLAAMGQQYRAQNMDKMAASRENLADYKQQSFDYNKNQPYQIAFAQNQKLQDQNRMDNQNMVNDVQALSAMGGKAVGGINTKKKQSTQSLPYSPLASNTNPAMSSNNYRYGNGNPNSFYTF